MSVLLYRLGGRSRGIGLVIGGWLLSLVALRGCSMALGDHYDDTFSMPGTQSQEGQDLLLDRFDQTGTSGQSSSPRRRDASPAQPTPAPSKQVSAARSTRAATSR